MYCIQLGKTLNVPEPGQLTPVQVTASPLALTISRPSVLKGPYGHPEVDSFACRRGKNVISLGCGVKAAAFTDVTASAAAQRTDFIVNTAMILNTTITMAKNKHTSLPTRSIYSQWPSAPPSAGMWGNVVRQGVQVVDDPVKPVSLLQHDMVSSVGSMQAEFKQTFYLGQSLYWTTTSFSCCAGGYCMVRAMHSLAWH